jgi:RHS repeat-associated protein
LTSHFQYDDDGLVTQARVLTNELNLTRSGQTGFVTATTLSDVDTAFDYNKYGETAFLSATTSGLDFSQTLARDALGRVTTITENIDGLETVSSFTYDKLGQLTAYEKNGEKYAYTYDANGNRLSYEAPGGVLYEGAYDEQDRIHSWDKWTYSYTEQGDLVQRTDGELGLTLKYDELGNLLRADLDSSNDALGINYQVDAMGRRMSRVTSNGDEHYWVYQDALRPVGEVANGIFTQYVYANDGLGGAPDFMVRSGVPYRLIKDHIGSVRFVVNANTGAVLQELEYDPFGRVLSDSNPGFQPFGFAGGLYDWDTKLVRFGARDYDPGVGRWTAKDLIGFAGGQENVYVYVGGDPVNFVDPEGARGFAIGTSLTWGGTKWQIGPAFSVSGGIAFDWSEAGFTLANFGSGFVGGGFADHASWTIDATYIHKDIEAFAGKDVATKVAVGMGVVGAFSRPRAAVPAGEQLDAQKERIKFSGAFNEAGNAETQRRSALVYLSRLDLDKKLSDPWTSPRRAGFTLPN